MAHRILFLLRRQQSRAPHCSALPDAPVTRRGSVSLTDDEHERSVFGVDTIFDERATARIDFLFHHGG
jgi:hypothetical protein